ncbi:MAG: alanine--tRNA ligase [Thiotrichales bacterium]
MQTTADIRRSFLDFFAAKGHEIVASSPLVPANDPTLLFTNAGMVQFKEVFLGTDPRPYHRAVSVQRCMRAGGKHNDLENVGYTARHHTFFEMLGNFSFGDYFKAEAIVLAWEYLTGVLGLPAERLWVTVYQDDAEAAEVWLNQIKVDPARFSRIGDKPGGKRYESDNFWSMGDTGPCGPCTEIFFDHGPGIAGGPPGTPEEDGDRYIEIWNLVFMQYDRNAAGELKPLPKPSVDTGMGLERLAAVLQGVHGNYEIDLFCGLIGAAAAATGATDLGSASLKVIADHIRACSFLIADGVLPANEGRGYVLRRIIRRAARHGHKLGQSEPFLHTLVTPLVKEMGAAYPELGKGQAHIERVLKQEEQRFAETLDKGMGLLQEAIAGNQGDTLAGATVFKLYDTYGFPVDLTADVAREHGLKLDMDGFETAMAGQRERARSASQFAAGGQDMSGLTADLRSEFLGYDAVSAAAIVTALLRDGQAVNALEAGEEGVVILDRTPFYAESGGQVGDHGTLRSAAGTFTVRDTQKRGHAIAHLGVAAGRIAVGDTLSAEVDAARRQAIVLNHSATHLMHAALRNVLGEHVQQKGSLVTPERLRFDFSHYEPMTREQIAEVERIVNDEIRANAATAARVMSMDAALATGAMALFGEKYGDEVRVVNIGFSTELCGGTHVTRAGDIGVFKVLSEGGVAAGVRRIEATTGTGALGAIDRDAQSLRRVAGMLKSDPSGLEARVAQLVAREKELEKEIEQLNSRLAARAGDELVARAVEVGGIKVLAANIDGIDPKSLRDTVDQLKQKLGRAAIVLATVQQGKVSLVAGVTQEETRRIKAGDLINVVAQQVGGRGGGRPDMAQAGGNDPTHLNQALQAVPEWVQQRLSGI